MTPCVRHAGSVKQWLKHVDMRSKPCRAGLTTQTKLHKTPARDGLGSTRKSLSTIALSPFPVRRCLGLHDQATPRTRNTARKCVYRFCVYSPCAIHTSPAAPEPQSPGESDQLTRGYQMMPGLESPDPCLSTVPGFFSRSSTGPQPRHRDPSRPISTTNKKAFTRNIHSIYHKQKKRKKDWFHPGSNRRPSRCERDAITN